MHISRVTLGRFVPNSYPFSLFYTAVSEEQPSEISIVYDKAPGKPTISATGAIGGPSPDQKSVVVHLYVESIAVPAVVTHDVAEDGTVNMAQVSSQVSRGNMVREIQATLVLSPEAAVVIGVWLANHGKNAIEKRGNSDDG